MVALVHWDRCGLIPATVSFNQRPFSRGGGRTLSGIERTTLTDLGYWEASLESIVVRTTDQRRTWNAIRTALRGRSGLVAVPAYEHVTAPYALTGGAHLTLPLVETLHSDDTPFSDETPYVQGAIAVTLAANVGIAETIVTLRLLEGEANLVGVRFSYQHALYETGPLIEVDGSDWTVPVFPAIRAPIPAGATLNFDRPTCLMHLADDAGMDIGLPMIDRVSRPTVEFVEAVDYFNDLAVGLA